MNRALVTYATLAGSSAQVAEAVSREMDTAGWQVTLIPLADQPNPREFDAVVVGGPMIMGWHRQARRFLRRHRQQWVNTPLVVFITAMKLTGSTDGLPAALPVTLDHGIMQEPEDPDGLSWRERYSKPSNYIRPVLQATKPTQPVSLAIFGGRLLYGQLPWWALPIAFIAAGGQAGDKRDWELIRSWAVELSNTLKRPDS